MKRSEASYTVETAFLMPIILVVVIALIQICFVLHDRVVIREALEYIALTAEKNTGMETTRKEDAVYEYFEQDGVFLISEVIEYQFDESWRTVEVLAKLKSEIIIPFFPRSGGFVKEYSARRKKIYAKEKTIISEIVLDTLHVLQ